MENSKNTFTLYHLMYETFCRSQKPLTQVSFFEYEKDLNHLIIKLNITFFQLINVCS